MVRREAYVKNSKEDDKTYQDGTMKTGLFGIVTTPTAGDPKPLENCWTKDLAAGYLLGGGTPA